MLELDRIIDQLEREHGGDPWHGSPLSRILDGITWQQAAAKPLKHAHSIWELVLHLAAWKNEVRNRLTGAAAGEPEAGDWPAVGEPSAERWAQARERLETAHRLLVSGIKAFPEENLHLPINDSRDQEPGAGLTHHQQLLGILQHDVYHAGQIAILKKGV